MVHPVGLGCGFKAPRRKQAFQKDGLQKPTLTQETLPQFTLWAWGGGFKAPRKKQAFQKEGFPDSTLWPRGVGVVNLVNGEQFTPFYQLCCGKCGKRRTNHSLLPAVLW